MEKFNTSYDFAENDYHYTRQDELDKMKSVDPGYTFIYRKVENKNGIIKNKKIELYTSGDYGSNIRDAITGKYYLDKVGTNSEHFFFKVGLSSGECKSKNGSTTLFFLSPEQYERQFHTELSDTVKNEWVEKSLHYKMLSTTVVKPSSYVSVK